MFYSIKNLNYVGDYKLKFANGEVGILNLENIVLNNKAFSSLADKEYFKQVYIDPEWETLCWPNGIDFDPECVYYKAMGKEIPEKMKEKLAIK